VLTLVVLPHLSWCRESGAHQSDWPLPGTIFDHYGSCLLPGAFPSIGQTSSVL